MDHFIVHHGLLHVSLGAMQREYIPLFMPGVNDPVVSRGTTLRPPITIEREYVWHDSDKGGDIIFAILLHERNKEDNIIGYRYIGHTGLHNITYPDGHATSGTIIADKSCFGKGYGTEAKLLLLYEAFRNRGLRKVCSHVKAFNSNSWGHLLACGFREVGRRKAHHFYDGGFIDDIGLEIFRDDWEPLWVLYREKQILPKLAECQRELLRKESGSS